MHLTRVGTLVRLNTFAEDCFKDGTKSKWFGALGEYLYHATHCPCYENGHHIVKMWWPELDLEDYWSDYWLEPYNHEIK